MARAATRVSPVALTPRQFLELVNNTPLGVVCSPRKLQRMREAAGARLGRDGKISLPAVAAWLRQRRAERLTKAARQSIGGLAAAPELLRRLTLEQLAKLLRVNPRVARRWRDEQGMPVAGAAANSSGRSAPGGAAGKDADGERFDLVEVCAWFAHRKGMKAAPREGEENIESMKVKKLWEEVVRLRLGNSKSTGESVQATAVSRMSLGLASAFATFSGRLEAILRPYGDEALKRGQQGLVEISKDISASWEPLRIAWRAAIVKHAAGDDAGDGIDLDLRAEERP